MQVTADIDHRTEYLVPASQYQMVSYSPFAADFDLSPVNSREYMASYQAPFWQTTGDQPHSQATLRSVEVFTSKPIAHLWTDFDIIGPRLGEQEVNMLR